MKKRVKNIISAVVIVLGLVLYQQKKGIITQWQNKKLKANNADKQVRGQFDNQKIYFLNI